MTFFRASLDTRNFSFEAFGTTKGNAEVQLGLTLVKHGLQYKLPIGWHNQYVDDIKVSEFSMGCGYRDGEKL